MCQILFDSANTLSDRYFQSKRYQLLYPINKSFSRSKTANTKDFPTHLNVRNNIRDSPLPAKTCSEQTSGFSTLNANSRKRITSKSNHMIESYITSHHITFHPHFSIQPKYFNMVEIRSPPSKLSPKTNKCYNRYQVSHAYVDRSHESNDSCTIPINKSALAKQPFPVKLHKMLSVISLNEGVVGWLPHGRAFLVKHQVCAWFAFHEYGMGSLSHFLYLVAFFVLMV